MANIQKKKFTKFQIKAAFEYFTSLVSQQGKRPGYSAFIFTISLMRPLVAHCGSPMLSGLLFIISISEGKSRLKC